jgi:asparagine synthase (glutamine-hydrolysing)
LNKLKNFIYKDFISNYISTDDDFGLRQLVRNDYRNVDKHSTIFQDIIEKINREKPSYVKALQYLELRTILPGRMLYKIDRFSMYYGIEARSPLLDHKLAEMAFTIPERFNVKNRTTKLMLKKLLEKDYDNNFIYRKKMGFGNPFSHWFEQIDFNKVFKILIDQDSEIFRYLEYDKLHEYFPDIKNGYKHKGGNEKELWRMLVLGYYFEKVKDVLVH